MRQFISFRSLFIVFAVCMQSIFSFGQPSAASRSLTGPLLDQAKVKLGETIPEDLVVYTEAGNEISLLEVLDGKYTVLVSGCLTCPIFHRTYPGVEAVYQDYKELENVQFFYLYKTLAHPEYNGYIQPVTLKERLAHIVEAKRVLDTSLNWLCDGMDNAARHTLGLGPNTQIIFSPKGKIIHTLGWSDGEVLREALIEHVGDTASHTRVADLNIQKKQSAMSMKDVGNAPMNRPTFDSNLIPVTFKVTEEGKHPLYVKPRIEVDPSVLQRGRGEMYLGFHLDPIHNVHWNNLAAPLKYEITLPEGVYATPKMATAPEVDVDSDAAPREFVVELSGAQPGDILGLVFHYFACSDEEGWCVPVTQKYEIALSADIDGGGTMGRSFRGGSGGQNRGRGGRGGGSSGRQPQGSGQMKSRIMQSDSDGDGRISESEAPQQMQRRFAQIDLDSDGYLSEEEIDGFMASLAGQGGQRPGGPGQGGRGQRGSLADLMNFDENGDGKITMEELPEGMQQRFGRMDENGDGVIDQMEIDALAERFRGGRGQRQQRRAQPLRQSGNENI
ncbi:MAG: EF-hand domain-containing protein [Verrucomicrobia bacterium]|nr:EF-hand domain-containing protein [Verrucomicrobiota bacterium]